MKKNKLTAVFMAFLVTICAITPVLAEPDAETAADGESAEYDTQATISSNTIYQEDEALAVPDTASQAALLLDADSGRLLYGKNIDVKLYPASLTKMMTGILALENGNLEETVKVPYEAIASINYLEDSNMGLLSDEELTLDQLVSAMLIHSANDAANVIAFNISGSLEAFVELMNQKAQELGMSNTHFANACGSHDDNHYTTARDMVTLVQYAMQNEKFREIVKTPIYKIPATNKYTLGERILVNTNLLLSTSRSMYQYYPAATGVKTGHTSQAGYCLAASASYQDANLITVVMKCDSMDSHNDPKTYEDTRNLFEFAFANYIHQQLANPGDIISDSKVREAKNDTRVALTVENPVSALVPADIDSAAEIVKNINLPEDLRAPIKKDDVVGTVTYTYKGTQIGTANLVATNDVELNKLLHVFNVIIKIITSPFFFIPVILLLILSAYTKHLKKKRARKRRIQQLKKAREGQNPDTGKYTPNRKAQSLANQRQTTKDSTSRYRK